MKAWFVSRHHSILVAIRIIPPASAPLRASFSGVRPEDVGLEAAAFPEDNRPLVLVIKAKENRQVAKACSSGMGERPK